MTTKATFIDETPFFFSEQSLRRFRYGNGLRVVLLKDSTAPVLAYHTWYKVGSAHETPGKTGLAHLFEHLMFNESKGFHQGQFDHLIEEAGGRSNAATWVDWTFYYESVPSDALELIVKLEADRMANLVLREKQVSTEKEVVRNERRYRVEDDIEGKAAEMLFATVFQRHAYGWPTIGWMQDIENFTKEDCQMFYKTFYAPNNATIVIVGDFSEPDTLELLGDYYAAIPPAQIPTRRRVREPAQKRERQAELRVPTPGEKLSVGYRAPAVSKPDHAALSVLSEILFGGRSGRLVRRLIYENEAAAEVRGSVLAFREPGLFEMWFSMRENQPLKKALSALQAEIRHLQRTKIKRAELEKVQHQIELDFFQTMEIVSGKAEQFGFFETVCGHSNFLFKRLKQLRAVSADDVQRVAKKYLRDTQRSLIKVYPNA